MKSLAKKLFDICYYDLYYTIGYGTLAGLGNGYGDHTAGNRFDYGFGEGFINNAKLGLLINPVYPILFKHLQKGKNYRRNAHLFNLGLNLLFLGWHYYVGTANPIQTQIPSLLVGVLMVNKHVSETLDEKLKSS